MAEEDDTPETSEEFEDKEAQVPPAYIPVNADEEPTVLAGGGQNVLADGTIVTYDNAGNEVARQEPPAGRDSGKANQAGRVK